MHEEVDELFNRGVDVLEQNKSNECRLSGKSERLVERSVANEQGKEPENSQQMKLGNYKDFQSMVHGPMAQFVSYR